MILVRPSVLHQFLSVVTWAAETVLAARSGVCARMDDGCDDGPSDWL